jgi:tetraacyldisaccharide 4'-kinase
MAAVLQRAWLRRGPLAAALWPAAVLFEAVSAARRVAFRRRWLDVYRAPVPVVVVGNVVAGGAGKTPVVIAMVEHLRGRGLQVGVVSRGYGRTSRGCREVRDADAAGEAGDEPLLVRRRTGVPVFVAERRAEAARGLLAAYPETQVIVSDDGLQHHAMARDVEICVFDERGIGNGWILPAGPLRERWPRPVDFVLCQAGARGVQGYAVMRGLADTAQRADGRRMRLAEWAASARGPVSAVAGIARPEVFFSMLEARGLRLARAIALADHASFAGVALPDGELLCTEKDAVKLWAVRPDAWAVPLEVEIEPAFWDAFDRRLAPKLSSPHGSETA